MSAAALQALIRFLATDAKLPLSQAVRKVKELQQAHLNDIGAIAKADLEQLKAIFADEKQAKQIHNAAKRHVKKRSATDDPATGPATPKKRKDQSLFSLPTEQSSQQSEQALALPYSDASVEELVRVKLFSNRAPLVLAMTVMLLKYTMPEQPLSSRLSLAQGYVSTTSRARAVSLGLETGRSADEEGFGDGQPRTSIMGKELPVLRRWHYDGKPENAQVETELSSEAPQDTEEVEATMTEEKPALWALDLEAFRKSKSSHQNTALHSPAATANMPIHTPQSARAYLMKSFTTPVDVSDAQPTKKLNAVQMMRQREENLGLLLRAIDLLYESWVGFSNPDDIEKRVWGWYVKARPAVEPGVAGWGGKNVWSLADLLSSRRETRSTLDSFIKKEIQE